MMRRPSACLLACLLTYLLTYSLTYQAHADAARSHPVLLIDSAEHGLCHLTTLGALLPSLLPERITAGRLPDLGHSRDASRFDI